MIYNNFKLVIGAILKGSAVIGTNVDISLVASIYSPSISFNVLGYEICISSEIGAAGFEIEFNKEKGIYEIKWISGISVDWTIERK